MLPSPDRPAFYFSDLLPPDVATSKSMSNILNKMLTRFPSQSLTPDQTDTPVHTRHPHMDRHAGVATFPTSLLAASAILTGSQLPAYKLSSHKEVDAGRDMNSLPQLTLDIILEAGPCANLEPTFRRKIASLSSWVPPIPLRLNFTLHPFYRTLTQQTLSSTAYSCEVVSDASQSEKFTALKKIWHQIQDDKPLEISLLAESDRIQLNPLQEIQQRMQSLASAPGLHIPVLMTVEGNPFKPDFDKRYAPDDPAVLDSSIRYYADFCGRLNTNMGIYSLPD